PATVDSVHRAPAADRAGANQTAPDGGPDGDSPGPPRDRLNTRASTAAATAAAEPTSTSATHQTPRSLPAVREWRKAAGQAREASQWTARQARWPRRCRTRLVISTAPPRSTARVPRPMARVRYGEAKGSRVAAQPIVTNGSRIAVTTCSPSSATANSESVRCRSAIAKRGQRPGAEPVRVATPSTTTMLNKTSRTRPLPRERNHRDCDPALIAAPPFRVGRRACGRSRGPRPARRRPPASRTRTARSRHGPPGGPAGPAPPPPPPPPLPPLPPPPTPPWP